jgi:hypothetical protein
MWPRPLLAEGARQARLFALAQPEALDGAQWRAGRNGIRAVRNDI